MTITNLNIPGENNDMIDLIDNMFNNPIFSDEIKDEVKNEIKKLKSNLDNKYINWTQNEQKELSLLIENVLGNNEVDVVDKIRIFITIINKKIQNELKESELTKIIKPLDIIKGIKGNKIINEYGTIKDKFVGNSDYVLIIVPSIHKKILGLIKSSNSTQELFEQNHNINIIFGELIKNGYSKTYSFEGNLFNEISYGYENGISSDFVKSYEEYMMISKSSDIDKEQIIALQKKILNHGIVNVLPEIQYGEKLLSYGIENFTSHFMAMDLYEFIDIIVDNEIGIDDMGNFIEIFIQEKQKIYINYFGNIQDVKKYIITLRKELDIDGIDEIGIQKYIENLVGTYVDFLHNQRNKDSVENIEQINKNTKANGIILRYGSAHFGYSNKELEYLTRKGIIKKEDIINIKQILKEKGISYIEILPKK